MNSWVAQHRKTFQVHRGMVFDVWGGRAIARAVVRPDRFVDDDLGRARMGPVVLSTSALHLSTTTALVCGRLVDDGAGERPMAEADVGTAAVPLADDVTTETGTVVAADAVGGGR